MATEVRFSQSAAVTRCRNVKESKLKAQYAIAKLADEEVTIFTAQLEDTRHQLSTQLFQQSAVDMRQHEEAHDVKVSWERKQQLNSLIDKLTSIKKMIMFNKSQGKRVALKSKIRRKGPRFKNVSQD
ncbi:hypothetical protein BCR33DRAFT_207709 [Rhizoclosmatium globosum]|uniref:Uncharacterized protein n=1 Tax=Rhizoclosmatium globosum TaxID=329046 RepID=A0A1Y2CCS8_9FUNG|nr:hypothetical protein BCR33DRAFT_207709 [Rhizoclosmatium globosum]|eukprot:ORY44736.1 hypothetical protein BCR33DRAFT_207709 [Rhizoclosmatium globosum]